MATEPCGSRIGTDLLKHEGFSHSIGIPRYPEETLID